MARIDLRAKERIRKGDDRRSPVDGGVRKENFISR